MKQEFKWILNIEIEVDEELVETDDPELLYNEVRYAIECAQDSFFNPLGSSDVIASWEVINEELK